MFGELVVVDDVPAEFAERIIEAFHGRPNDGFTLALSGGDTARRCYERLADDAGSQIDWWKVDIYWGDERCVPVDSPESNYRLVREAVDRGVPLRDIDPEANVIADLRRIILPEEAAAATGKQRSLFGLPLGFLRKAG